MALIAALAAAPPAGAQPAPPALPVLSAPPSMATPPATSEPASPPAAASAASTPAADAMAAPSTLPDLLQTRIEQVKRGNRVSEVRVTGPGGELRYTMENREGGTPPSPQNAGSGLSTPSFFRIEF
jgi:pyruvate dehydrogenase E2 component (dihydrolipoamide acetyltransferase)